MISDLEEERETARLFDRRVFETMGFSSHLNANNTSNSNNNN